MSAIRRSWANTPRPRRILLIVALLVIPCLCLLALLRIFQPPRPPVGEPAPAPATDTPVAAPATDTPAAAPATNTPTAVVVTVAPTTPPATAAPGAATATPTPDVSTHTPTPTMTPRSDLPDTGGILPGDSPSVLTWLGLGLLLLFAIGALRRLRRPAIN